MNDMSDDRIVLITGAGSGLGQELAKAFAAHGSAITIGFGRTRAKLEQTEQLAGAERFRWIECDVSDPDAVASAIAKIVAEHGRIDVVFNNAAVYPKVDFLEESPSEWAAALSCNVNGVANVCKAVLPVMLKQESGRIFNVGSWAHRAPIEKSAAYSASKGALHALTRAIGADVAARGSRVEVHEWIPGHLNTQMSDYTGMDPALAAKWGVQLAFETEAGSANSIFEGDQEWTPPKSLKQKILGKLAFWR